MLFSRHIERKVLVFFNRLFTIINLPIERIKDYLKDYFFVSWIGMMLGRIIYVTRVAIDW